MKHKLLLIVLSLIFSSCRQQVKVFPEGIVELQPYVTDYASIYSPEEELELINEIKESRASSDLQIVVLTVNNIEPFDEIKDYALSTGNENGIGDQKKEDAVFIVIAYELREIYIASGRGVTHRITDDELKIIIDETITPRFGIGYYFEGTIEGIKEIAIMGKE